MREIKEVIVHCLDSPYEKHFNLRTIDEWHAARGFDWVGYHYVITHSAILKGRDEEQMGAGVRGYNRNSIHICMCGRHSFTMEQKVMLAHLCIDLAERYNIPDKKIRGHRDYNKLKTCPNFSMIHFKKIINKFRKERLDETTA